jgi:hypothetical protein
MLDSTCAAWVELLGEVTRGSFSLRRRLPLHRHQQGAGGLAFVSGGFAYPLAQPISPFPLKKTTLPGAFGAIIDRLGNFIFRSGDPGCKFVSRSYERFSELTSIVQISS